VIVRDNQVGVVPPFRQKASSMLAEPRRRLLLELISERGFATLEELVRLLGVSESTVRRDLEALDSTGVIKRTHGGAVTSAEVRAMPAHEDRLSTAAAEKRAIGRTTAALIEDGETVLLDGGTTTMEVARALLGRPVQVVTNSIPIANLMSSNKQADVILIGGYVSPRTGVAMGPLAVEMMRGIRVRKAILGAGGLVAEGVYNSNVLLVETERQMMACGQEVVIVADHTKFGRLSLSKLCDLDAIDAIVVDPAVPDSFRPLLEAAGVTLHVAPMEGDPAEPSPGQSRLNGAARTEP
jgi:DeoR family fructose operon transcriptional repressor